MTDFLAKLKHRQMHRVAAAYALLNNLSLLDYRCAKAWPDFGRATAGDDFVCG